MAAKLLFSAVAVVLLFAGCVVGKQNPYTTRCSMTERSFLFNQCLMAFGWAHWNDRTAMRNSNQCLLAKLQCPAAEACVNCINNIPATKLNDNCWDGLKETLSFMLVDYGFGCAYTDIERKCWNKIPQLVSKSRRAMRQARNGRTQRLPLRPPA